MLMFCIAKLCSFKVGGSLENSCTEICCTRSVKLTLSVERCSSVCCQCLYCSLSTSNYGTCETGIMQRASSFDFSVIRHWSLHVGMDWV
jgi:hypothetical protein